MIPIPQEQKTTTLPPSPPANVGQPIVKHRGRKKGEPRPPARPMDEIYADKISAAFRSASLLVRRLKSLSRDRYVRESPLAKEKYMAFLATMNDKIADASRISAEAEKETLKDWTG